MFRPYIQFHIPPIPATFFCGKATRPGGHLRDAAGLLFPYGTVGIIPGTSIGLIHNGCQTYAGWSPSYWLAKGVQRKDRTEFISLGALLRQNFNSYQVGIFAGSAEKRTTYRDNIPSAMEGMIGLFDMGAERAGGDADAVKAAGELLSSHFKECAALYNGPEYFPFSGNEIARVLSQSGDNGLAVAEVVHSSHIKPLDDGRLLRHIYLLRKPDLISETESLLRILIAETKTGWSCGPERLGDHRSGRVRSRTIKTSWHKNFGGALTAALSMFPTLDENHSGHERMAEAELIGRLEAACRGAKTPDAIFPASAFQDHKPLFSLINSAEAG